MIWFARTRRYHAYPLSGFRPSTGRTDVIGPARVDLPASLLTAECAEGLLDLLGGVEQVQAQAQVAFPVGSVDAQAR